MQISTPPTPTPQSSTAIPEHHDKIWNKFPINYPYWIHLFYCSMSAGKYLSKVQTNYAQQEQPQRTIALLTVICWLEVWKCNNSQRNYPLALWTVCCSSSQTVSCHNANIDTHTPFSQIHSLIKLSVQLVQSKRTIPLITVLSSIKMALFSVRHIRCITVQHINIVLLGN